MKHFLLDAVAALLHESFSLLCLDAEGRHLPVGQLLCLYLLLGVVVDQLQGCVLVQVHPGCDNTVALRAEDRALALRANERALVLMVHRPCHNDLVPLRGLERPGAGPTGSSVGQRGTAALDQVFRQTNSLFRRHHQVGVSDVDVRGDGAFYLTGDCAQRSELAARGGRHLGGGGLGQCSAEGTSLGAGVMGLLSKRLGVDEEGVLGERLVLERGIVHGRRLVEVKRLVEPVVVLSVDSRGPLLLLTHLDAYVVQLLHSLELSEVRLALLLVVLEIVNVLQAEVLQLLTEQLDLVLHLLQAVCVLLDQLLDRLELHVDRHLNGCKVFPSHISYHFARDLVKLVIEVGLFELDQTPYNVLHLLVAVLQHEILTLFHLVHFVELFLNPGHRVLGDTLSEGRQLRVDIVLL